MPKPRSPVIKGPARRDLIDIAKETEAKWGTRQRDRYLSRIEARIKTLAYTPKMGAQREDIGEGRRALVAGKHIIIYRVIDGRPEISRILHGSRDLERKLDRARSKSQSIER